MKGSAFIPVGCLRCYYAENSDCVTYIEKFQSANTNSGESNMQRNEQLQKHIHDKRERPSYQ